MTKRATAALFLVSAGLLAALFLASRRDPPTPRPAPTSARTGPSLEHSATAPKAGSTRLSLSVRVASPTGAVRDADVVLLSADDRTAVSELTTANGTATFRQLLPGKYQVSVLHPDYAPAHLTHRVTAGTAPLNVTLVAGARLHLTVQAQSGAPIAGARLLLYHPVSQTEFGQGVSTERWNLCLPARTVDPDGGASLEW